MTLLIGDVAPDFEADTTEGPIRFHEWAGRRLGGVFLAPRRLHARVHD
jgi:alkyl hydroperoxide reductase subunit AhpC